MKTCSYCGKKNLDEKKVCDGCGMDLADMPDKPAQPSRPALRPSASGSSSSSVLLSAGFFREAEPLDMQGFDMGFSFQDGFSWPNWKQVGTKIRTKFPEERWAQAWREVGVKWLAQLKEDLGGNYQQYESWNYLLLSAETAEDSEGILRTAEEVMDVIESYLAFPSSRSKLYGKRVIIAFNEDDDYYSYISHFYPDGNFSTSSGIFIKAGGYAHVAFPFVNIRYVRRVLVHELVHNSLFGLPVPKWVNEGLAVRIEREAGHSLGGLTRREEDILNQELVDLHHTYWNEKTIQEFWAGISFGFPNEGSKLSYSLAEILVEVLSDNWADFLNFAQNADPRDAGQDAALKCLNRCLGDAASEFLGPGQWRPDRKSIADLWKATQKPPAK